MTCFCILGEYVVFLENVLKTQYIFLVLGTWECSSVEHSTADREVGGSNPLAPFFIIIGYLPKDFRQLNIRLVLIVHYFELRRHMNHAFSSYFILIYDGVLYI